MVTINASNAKTGQQYFVLLVDCGNDEPVKGRIREEHDNLTKTGYSRLIGVSTLSHLNSRMRISLSLRLIYRSTSRPSLRPSPSFCR